MLRLRTLLIAVLALSAFNAIGLIALGCEFFWGTAAQLRGVYHIHRQGDDITHWVDPTHKRGKLATPYLHDGCPHCFKQSGRVIPGPENGFTEE